MNVRGGRALVVGGGIGGLAAALALRQAGWEVDVFERVPKLAEVGAGIALWSNGLRALDRLGVGQEVRSRARRHDGGAIRNEAGDILMRISAPGFVTEGGAWLGAMIHRADLLAILAEAVGGGAIHTGRELTGVQEAGERVTARFQDGSSAEGDLLVGADGIHSAVRRSLLGEVIPRYAGYTVWRWVCDFPPEAVRPGETWGAGRRFGHAALPGGRVYAYATSDVPVGGRGPHGEAPELRRLFGTWHTPIPELLAGATEEHVLRNDCYDLLPLRRWSRGRVTLLGDAAHAMTPNLGQGACQALEDAVALGRCLSGQERHVAAGLRVYERQRKPRATRFQRRSWSAGALGQWSHPLAVILRGFLARQVLSRLQGLQMKAVTDVAI